MFSVTTQYRALTRFRGFNEAAANSPRNRSACNRLCRHVFADRPREVMVNRTQETTRKPMCGVLRRIKRPSFQRAAGLRALPGVSAITEALARGRRIRR